MECLITMETEKSNDIPLSSHFLPVAKIYNIQINNENFKVSGKLLNFDSPNLFTNHFNNDPSTDFIHVDRDERSFRTILRYWQGYCLTIEDELEFLNVFLDAIHYKLLKLSDSLKKIDYYFVNIGGKSFKIPKHLFQNQGDSNNYFYVLTNTYFTTIERNGIGRLKSNSSLPIYIERSSEYFQDILNLLYGYDLKLSTEKRKSLLKECKFYRLLNLEQRLINCMTNLNPMINDEIQEEILINLNDVAIRGLQLKIDDDRSHGIKNVTNRTSCEDYSYAKVCTTPSSSSSSPTNENEHINKRFKVSKKKENITWNIVKYMRPYIDAFPRELIFQLNSNENTIIFNKANKIIHIDIVGSSLIQFEEKFTKLLKGNNIDLNKFKYKISNSKDSTTREHLILPACINISDLKVNDISCRNICQLINDSALNENVIDVTNIQNLNYSPGLKLYLKNSCWKLGVKNNALILIAIKIDSFCGVKEYHKTLDFI
ncbi:hypothetical protein KAFR_0B02950 [Kazachstania africana CBS 2517]|uniref:Potassium channel tetramerisation-type BTB domain-containing protein n=1 Tax=Kazachstania africana (strain ATCC 22294 / BCRC 22015 / CBS 2517 / CECT 1963 / NBRC 1671 / NRRL Y-8276) TaxID=1071382 RepID=H2AQE1_KAZAF|nr:hypothetical protein KAFR_0B02950 [Kazachstania africana CBS 2517]CCF56591.1 hypothetical protein KAFR_0B02950 [Kazachstania africana CBS 2517]